MPSYAVTGASRGIGLEFVRQISLHEENIVFGIVRNRATAHELSRLVVERANVHILEADVTEYRALKAAADEVARVTGGALTCLINNAAHLQDLRRTYTLDEYDRGEEDLLGYDLHDVINTNVLGVIHGINAFLPLLKAATNTNVARVVTISSMTADLDLTLSAEYYRHGAYSISKAAVNMAMAKYAAWFHDENIVFLSICPGIVDTATRTRTPEELEVYAGFVKFMQKAYPEWNGEQISPKESVEMMLGVILRWSRKDSGAFVSRFGNNQWI
ncbi:hypothetical protein PHLGIDRAFT_114750 [Phlebiopsis gigantea 11061_1 CR5-6]|uniref:NAD(P)-binding protein n=1 Tax=Phlebiopsis gigantea (strain 11061_1 CR5-6) TaxID=745531 RepID=A0A0C3SF27_PHLG1|nr:hypothetical protein PHLGIDRAFT_114750 [Phlebiopsis gigantea 11061_1 CR5-6]